MTTRPNHALQPTAAPHSVPEVTAVRERTVRSTVALRRLWLSFIRSPTMTTSRKPQTHDAFSIYGRSYLVTLGLTFAAAASVLVWYDGGAEADAWPWWALPLIAVLMVAGVALILFGLFGPSTKMEAWAEVLSRHEASLIIMVLAYPVYLFLSPFYGRR